MLIGDEAPSREGHRAHFPFRACAAAQDASRAAFQAWRAALLPSRPRSSSLRPAPPDGGSFAASGASGAEQSPPDHALARGIASTGHGSAPDRAALQPGGGVSRARARREADSAVASRDRVLGARVERRAGSIRSRAAAGNPAPATHRNSRRGRRRSAAISAPRLRPTHRAGAARRRPPARKAATRGRKVPN